MSILIRDKSIAALLFTTLLAMSGHAFAQQASALDWAIDGCTDAHGTPTETHYATIADSEVMSDGSVVFCGTYRPGLTFRQVTGDDVLLGTLLGYEMCIGRYNPDGSLSWLRQLGSYNCDFAGGLDVHDDGTIAFAGAFGYPGGAVLQVFAGVAGATQLQSEGAEEVVVAKLDADGNLLWAHSAGSSDNDSGEEPAFASDGSVYVPCYIGGQAVFGKGTSSQVTISEDGSYTMVVAKYSPAGALLWVKEMALSDLAATSDGGFVTSLGYSVSKYNALGNLLWTNTHTGLYHSVEVLSNDDVIVYGADGLRKYDANGAFLWEDSFPVSCLAAHADHSFVRADSDSLSYCRADGTYVWTKLLPEGSSARSLCFSKDGPIYLGGAFAGDVTFGQGEVNETPLSTASSATALFMSRFQGPEVYEVNIQIQGVGVVATDPPSGMYTEGSIVNVIAHGMFPWQHFDHWEGDLTGDGTTFTVNGDMNITAVFTEDEDHPPLPLGPATAGLCAMTLLALGASVLVLRRT